MKIVFLTSPAYALVPMIPSPWSKLSAMTVSEAVLSICGTPLNDGAQMSVNSGTCRRYSSLVCGRMNMFRAKWLCHASSVMTRIGTRKSGSAPAQQSCTNRSRPCRKPCRRCTRSLNLSVDMGRLYWPHHTRSSLDGSRTTNLSLAERAVCLPVYATSAPCRVMRASLRKITSSYSASVGRFQYTCPRFVRPWLARP